jgi:5-methylcytosine-specific restriction protein B
MTRSEEVRKHVVEQYIAPARRKGEETVQVRAGNVHNELHWTGRVPSVCQALDSQKFEHEAGVELVDRSRPGPSTTVVFTYRLLDREDPQHVGESSAPANGPGQKKPVTLLDLYGVGAEIFRELGGAESFLKAERADWGPDPWERFEIEVTFRKKGRSI